MVRTPSAPSIAASGPWRKNSWRKRSDLRRCCATNCDPIPTCTTPATPRMPSRSMPKPTWSTRWWPASPTRTPPRSAWSRPPTWPGWAKRPAAPAALGGEPAASLAGLGEAAGELRRRTLDMLRHDQLAEAERLLAAMDDIYDLLVTVDYPAAITGGPRGVTDMVRGVVERTRGDLTTTHQQQALKAALRDVEAKLGRP